MVQRRIDHYLQRPEGAAGPTPGAASFLHLPYQYRYRIYILAGLVRFCPINLNQEGLRACHYRDKDNIDGDYACFYESRRFLGKGYAIDCIAGCQCPPLPFNLLYVSRAISEEVLRIMYHGNSFTVSASDAWGLRPLRSMSASAMASLRSLTVRLRNAQCVYGPAVFSETEATFPYCHPLCSTYQVHDRPLRRWPRQDRAVMQQWQHVAAKLAAHSQVGCLRLDLICDSANLVIAKDITESLFPLRHRLRDCSIRFGSSQNWEYFSLAKTTANGLVRRHGPKEPPKRTYHLPVEILTRILIQSDLIAPYGLEWQPDKGLTPFDCCKKCTATLDCCTCSRHHHGAYSTTCTCWRIPLSLFLVSKQVHAIATEIFFKENRFIVLPTGTRLYNVRIDSRQTFGSQALRSFLEGLPPGAPLLLRSLSVYLLPYHGEQERSRRQRKALDGFTQALALVTHACDVTKLGMALFMAFNYKEDDSDDWAVDWVVKRAEISSESPLPRVPVFRDFFLYTQWLKQPPGTRLPFCYAAMMERRVERVVMGPEYNAEHRGKWVDLPPLWYDGESREGPVFAADGSQIWPRRFYEDAYDSAI
ncbi:uncharacterized protein PG998_006465 [Apiospora kogelbergensis]|uniref:uncharacterized protein n=1 Tax=Apiospora kogelbergensis TaxID=1337665 RepID=UPI00313177DE